MKNGKLPTFEKTPNGADGLTRKPIELAKSCDKALEKATHPQRVKEQATDTCHVNTTIYVNIKNILNYSNIKILDIRYFSTKEICPFHNKLQSRVRYQMILQLASCESLRKSKPTQNDLETQWPLVVLKNEECKT